jgi:hypothetical protein
MPKQEKLAGKAFKRTAFKGPTDLDELRSKCFQSCNQLASYSCYLKLYEREGLSEVECKLLDEALHIFQTQVVRVHNTITIVLDHTIDSAFHLRELREAEQEERRIEGLQKLTLLQLRTLSARCHRKVTSVNTTANAQISAQV